MVELKGVAINYRGGGSQGEYHGETLLSTSEPGGGDE